MTRFIAIAVLALSATAWPAEGPVYPKVLSISPGMRLDLGTTALTPCDGPVAWQLPGWLHDRNERLVGQVPMDISDDAEIGFICRTSHTHFRPAYESIVEPDGQKTTTMILVAETRTVEVARKISLTLDDDDVAP
jgi:hypothetical protein